MIDISNRKECFFDDYLIDTEKTTARKIINNPVPEDIVMVYDKYWEINTSYIHFFYDEGMYRMYYIAWNRNKYIEAPRQKNGTCHNRLCVYDIP